MNARIWFASPPLLPTLHDAVQDGFDSWPVDWPLWRLTLVHAYISGFVVIASAFRHEPLAHQGKTTACQEHPGLGGALRTIISCVCAKSWSRRLRVSLALTGY